MFKYDIENVRQLNPLLAYLLEVVKPRWVPRVYATAVQFTTGTSGQNLPSGLARPMASDAWLYDLEYSIRVPNAFAGALFKPQFDFYNERQPFIDVDLQFVGAGATCDIRVTNEPEPLQHIARATGGSSDRFQSAVSQYFLIWKDQDMRVSWWLRKTLGNDELPTTITLIAKMLEIDRCRLCDIDGSADFKGYCDRYKLVLPRV